MDTRQRQIEQLIAFRNEKKFVAKAWAERGLTPSDDELCEQLTTLFDDAADEIIDAVNSNASNNALEKILKSSLSNFNKADYDTEEREFVCDVFTRLAFIVDVNFSYSLNRWLYGPLLATLVKMGRLLKPERVLETIVQPCTKCSADLKIDILAKDDTIPELGWWVVKCNSCSELNLLSPGAGIKQSRFGNYRLIETLPVEEYTYDQAVNRFNQIKAFRK